ncbi:hypothetical protein BO99DRAFT_433764 [Aspergillus violaceofuscus CBS 115571]|uniref:Uncharacterized protein n=1 Tax=Aspergillus violaceofuscus (strain CBS 115571) TaxID=1450538 RepID=A0A2V5H2I9_ASPV1|nr:hypothetical protein BO99DRAFT_433764 [Aspergillus violaceofuscus CBS 115571]
MYTLKLAGIVLLAASRATAWEVQGWTGVKCGGSEIYAEATTGAQACENFDTTQELHSVMFTYAKKNVVPHLFYEKDCKGTVYEPKSGYCWYNSADIFKSYKIVAAS